MIKKKKNSETKKRSCYERLIFKEPDGCQVCRDAMGGLFKQWTSPESISYQQNFLIEETCPQMPEPAGCSVGVLSWWEMIAKIIFSDGAAYFVCKGINSECDLPSTRYVLLEL